MARIRSMLGRLARGRQQSAFDQSGHRSGYAEQGWTVALAIAMLLAPSLSWSEMYSWTDKDGTVHFSDTPTPGAQKKQMPGSSQSGRGTVEPAPQPPSATGSPNRHHDKFTDKLEGPVKVAGTIWAGTDSDGTYTEYHFQVDGALHWNSTYGFWKNGTWRQDKNAIYMETNQKYSEYQGVITGTRMKGQAWNRKGHRWSWEADEILATDVSPPGVVPKPKQISKDRARDLDRLLSEIEVLLAQFSKTTGQNRRELINKITEKSQQLGQVGLNSEQDFDRVGGELGTRARKVAESLQQMASSMSQEDMMQMVLDMREGHMQKQGQSCEQGNPEACVKVADDRFSKDKWEEAKPLYTLACNKGSDQGCLGQAKVEAIVGDPTVARALIKKVCESGRSLGECWVMDFSASAYVHALPQSGNLVHANVPEGGKDKVKVHQPYLLSSDPARRSFGEGLKQFLGIERPVDLAQAERSFLQAEVQGMDVGSALIQVAADLRHVRSSDTYRTQTEVWAKVKRTLLHDNACGLGEQRACPDFEGYPQWNQARQSFVQGQFEEGKAMLQKLCGMGRISACLAAGAAEIAIGQPTRAREVHAKYCMPKQMSRNDQTKERCQILAARIKDLSGTANFDQAPFPEYFKPCFYKLREQIQQTGGVDGKIVADGLLEFLGVDRPVNKKETERLFLTVDQQWLKQSLVLTTAARQANWCPESGRNQLNGEGQTFAWKTSSLFMMACRLGDNEACREDGFKRYFYDFARDEDFVPVRGPWERLHNR